MFKFKLSLDTQSRLLFSNSSWVFFSNMYSTGLAFIRSAIIARGLGPGIYGTYALVVAFVGMIQELLNLNVGTALIRFGAIYHTQKRNDKLLALVKWSVKLSAIMAGFSVAIIAILSYIAYDHFFTQPGLHWFIIAYAIAASINYMNSVSKSMLRLYYKFRMSSVIQMIMDTVETIMIAIAIFIYPKNLNIFFVAVIVTRFLNGFICNLMAYYELKSEIDPFLYSPHEVIQKEQGTINKFIFGNSISNTLKTIITQGDILLLGYLAGEVQVGFYSVSKKLAYSILTLTDPLTSSIYPQLSKLVAEQKYHEAKKMLWKITSYALFPGIIFLLTTFFLNDWIITTVYGEEYLPAVPSFFYFVMGAVLGAITFWAIPLVQSLGMIRMRIYIYAITIAAGSVLAYLLIPSMQAAGMALALLITNVLNLILFVGKAWSIMNKKANESLIN